MAEATPKEGEHLIASDRKAQSYDKKEGSEGVPVSLKNTQQSSIRIATSNKNVAIENNDKEKSSLMTQNSNRGSDNGSGTADIDANASIECCVYEKCSGCNGCANIEWDAEGSFMSKVTSASRLVLCSRPKYVLFGLILIAQLFVLLAVCLDTLDNCLYKIKLGMFKYHGGAEWAEIEAKYYSDEDACWSEDSYWYRKRESCVEFQLRGYVWFLCVVFNWLEYINILVLFSKGDPRRSYLCFCQCCKCKCCDCACCECCRPTFEGELAKLLHACILCLIISVVVWKAGNDTIIMNDFGWELDCDIEGMGVSNRLLIVSIVFLFLSRVYLCCTLAGGARDHDPVNQQDDTQQADDGVVAAEVELQAQHAQE